jgi:hypothetical protein
VVESCPEFFEDDPIVVNPVKGKELPVRAVVAIELEDDRL